MTGAALGDCHGVSGCSGSCAWQAWHLVTAVDLGAWPPHRSCVARRLVTALAATVTAVDCLGAWPPLGDWRGLWVSRGRC